jgi:dihydropteroate synthase
MLKTKIMAILNVTSDSFSNDGLYNSPESAAQYIEQLLNSKPDILDIGAISTRPQNIRYFPSSEDEIERFKFILPVLSPLINTYKVEVSVDSFNPATIEYLLDKIPVSIINDQSACSNPKMLDFIKNTDLRIVLMHHLDLPVNPDNIIDPSLNIIEALKEWFMKRIKYLLAHGVNPEQIILDPGIGFGKNIEQNWKLIKNAKSFVKLGFSVLYGHSRKSFLNSVTDLPFQDRDVETAFISQYLMDCGVEYIRVHNPEMVRRMLRVKDKLLK